MGPRADKIRKGRVADRAEHARRLIRQALDWKTDDEAAWCLSSILAESRNPRLLAAIWLELDYLDTKSSDYGARALRVVKQATKALARELV